MASALPKIDQLGAPAGVVGESRTDIAVFSGLNPVVLTDTGGGSPVWQIIDKPEGSTATLSAPANPVCQFNGDLPGTYLIQLKVDGGGLPGQIVQLVIGVMTPLPSWVASTAADNLRIPAFGETRQMNVAYGPGSGANTRGWAYHVNRWFKAIAEHAFGVAISDNGVDVPGRFYKLNLIGAGAITDAGGGVIDLNVGGGGGGITQLRNAGGILAGAPWSILDARSPQVAFPTPVNSTLNVQFYDGGGGIGRLVVHNAHHNHTSHSAGAVLKTNTSTFGSLLPSLNNANPTPWSFAAIPAGEEVFSDGRLLTAADIPAPLTYALAGVQWALYDLVLDVSGATPVVAPRSLVTCPAPTINVVVLDLQEGHPVGVSTLEITNGPGNPRLSWGGGPPVSIINDTVYRLYNNAGFWVDVYVGNGLLGNGLALWTVLGTTTSREQRFRLVRVPHWTPGGGPYIWGVPFLGGDLYKDVRDTGTIAAADIQSLAGVLNRLGGDLKLLSGVVMNHRNDSRSGAEPYAGDFSLQGVAGPTPGIATGMSGGAFWLNGERFEVEVATNFAITLPASTSLLVYADVNKATRTVTVRFRPGSDPATLVASIQQAVNGPGALYGSIGGIPLYYGTTDGAGLLPPEGRLDLRRDVAHLGAWTVGGRSVFDVTGDPSVVPLQADPQVERLERPTAAEFDSIGAALVWQRVLELSQDSDTSDNLNNGGKAVTNAALEVRVIRNTYESYPFALWNNIAIVGEGNPTVVVPYRVGYSWFLIGGSPNFVGAPSNRTVRNVRVAGLTILGRDVPATIDGRFGGVIRVAAPEIDPLNPVFAGAAPLASCQDVILEDLTLGFLDNGPVLGTDTFAGIIFIGVAGPFDPGQFLNCRVSRVRIGNYNGQASSLVNTGVACNFSGDPNDVEITDCLFYTRFAGVTTDGLGTVKVQRNRIRVATATAPTIAGISATNTSVVVEGNKIDLDSPNAAFGLFMTDVGLSEFRGNEIAIDNAAATSRGISLNAGGPLEAKVTANRITGFFTAISLTAALRNTEISYNWLECPAITNQESAGILGVLGDAFNIDIAYNHIRGFRAGVNLDCDNETYGISIRANKVIGVLGLANGTPDPAPGHGRGVVVVFDSVNELNRDLEVVDNEVSNFALSASLDSANYTGQGNFSAGITVSARGGTLNRGVRILRNNVRAYLDPFGGNHRIRGDFAGIAILGELLDLEVVDNNVQNTLGAGENRTAGIWYDSYAGFLAGNHQARTIRGNTVGWISACTFLGAPSEPRGYSAGILISDTYVPIDVVDNNVSVQSVLDFSAVHGYIHGIFVGNGGNQPNTVRVTRNRIQTALVGDDPIYSEGAIGTGINIHASLLFTYLAASEVKDNHVEGLWQYTPTGLGVADLSSWAGICIAHKGDEGANNLRVAGNFVWIKSGSGWGGAPLHNGIRVGSEEHAAALSQLLENVLIQGNVVQIDGDSTAAQVAYPGLRAAGISVCSTTTAPQQVASLNITIDGNRVRRSDAAATKVIRGILNNGGGEMLVTGNAVNSLPGVFDLQDINVGGAMATQNVWANNRFGSVATPGTHSLATPPYQPVGAGTNWSGSAFV
jgi:hypothetical protein